MKKVRLHYKDGQGVVTKNVEVVAKQNGIKVAQVPDLIRAWEKMGAVKRRDDGGLDVIRYVAPGSVKLDS